jgi:hypothetical protein
MLRKNKLLIGIIAAVLLIGTMGGVAFAADNGDANGDGPKHGHCGAHLERICELYEEKTGVALDHDVLVEVMGEIREEMLANAPERPDFKDGERPTMQDRLQYLVEEGTITQEQADEFQGWLDAKPDFDFRFRPGPGPGGPEGHCPPFAEPSAE